MNEQKAVRSFRALTDIGDDLIEEAGAVQGGKKAPAWRRWGALAACLCLIALAGAGAWRWISLLDTPAAHGELPPGGANAPGSDQPPYADVPGLYDGYTLPGGIAPVLRVGDTLYGWAGMSVSFSLDPSGSYIVMADGSTYLPEGYEPYGEIGGVTGEGPTEDLQLQAGFEAAGTVFVSERHPAVVYVLMTTSWFEDSYVRFASGELGDDELVSWQGRTYRFSYDYDASPMLEALPEGCELIGKLHYVGDDAIPAGDLETNHRSDNYSKPIEGREVYAAPGDDSVLYIYEHHYWREGDCPAWRACYLWER